MASMTEYLRDALCKHVTTHTSYTSPTTLYLALYTVAPTSAGGGTEVTGGSYARQSTAFTFGTTGSGLSTNTAVRTFPSMPSCTVVAMALLDASTSGNMLFQGTLGTPKTVGVGENFVVDIGDVETLFA